ncbi:unnamed protein product, partial [Ostreobium quekettii]
MSEGRSLVLGPRLSTGLSHSVVKGEDFRAQQPNLRWSHDGSGETDFAFFGIFDGHGGKQVAKYCSKTLHDELQKTLSKQTQFPGALAVDLPGFQAAAKELSAFDGQDAVVQQTPEALVEAFTCADDVCRAMNLDSGTTATVAVLAGWEVIIGNVGDSLAVLDTGCEVLQVSGNHRLDKNKAEQERIQKAGGEIARSTVCGVETGPLRAWPGGLAMSRTIGDPKAGDFVTSVPEVRQFTWPFTGGRLIVASDGLWDAVSPKSACHSTRGMSAGQAANALVKASRKGKTSSRDDVTVLVVDAIPNEQGRLPAILHRTASGASTSSSSGQDSSEGCLIWKPLEENKGPSVNWRERS